MAIYITGAEFVDSIAVLLLITVSILILVCMTLATIAFFAFRNPSEKLRKSIIKPHIPDFWHFFILTSIPFAILDFLMREGVEIPSKALLLFAIFAMTTYLSYAFGKKISEKKMSAPAIGMSGMVFFLFGPLGPVLTLFNLIFGIIGSIFLKWPSPNLLLVGLFAMPAFAFQLIILMIPFMIGAIVGRWHLIPAKFN